MTVEAGGTSWFFSGSSIGFYWIYPAALTLSPGGAEWPGFPWRIPSESGGGLRQNTHTHLRDESFIILIYIEFNLLSNILL